MGSSPVLVNQPLRRALLLVLVLMAAVQHAAGAEVRAAVPTPTPQAIPLECRLQQGPWQPCWMEVVTIGSQWALVVGAQRWEFRHDGSGSMTMRQGAGSWRTVSSRWEDRNSLCWNRVFARGDIPLD